MALTPEDIDNIVTYHKINDEAAVLITDLRMQAHALMNLIRIHVPESREQSVAYTKVQEVLFWAVAGIARDPRYWAEDVD